MNQTNSCVIIKRQSNLPTYTPSSEPPSQKQAKEAHKPVSHYTLHTHTHSHSQHHILHVLHHTPHSTPHTSHTPDTQLRPREQASYTAKSDTEHAASDDGCHEVEASLGTEKDTCYRSILVKGRESRSVCGSECVEGFGDRWLGDGVGAVARDGFLDGNRDGGAGKMGREDSLRLRLVMSGCP